MKIKQNIPKISKNNVILIIFLAIALGYLAWCIYIFFKNEQGKEHFTTEPLTDYQARMTVMKVFDTVLLRKPKPDEIDKYSKITNEQDMLVAVLSDYKGTASDELTKVVTTAETSIANAPTVATVATTATATIATATTATAPATNTSATNTSATPVPLEPSEKFVVKQESSSTTQEFKITPTDISTIQDTLSGIVDLVNTIRAQLSKCETRS